MQDEIYMKKYFFIKNSISIPNFNLTKRSNNSNSNNKFYNNNQKILIMGDLNQSEIYEGIIKLTKLKYFLKFEKKLSFVVKGNYNNGFKEKLKEIFTNIEFQEVWIDDDIYLDYLDSFKALLFLDSVDFGLSNRVIDGLKSKSLIVGFEKAFTGYSFKNFNEVIFLNNFYDLIYAIRLNETQKNEIIKKANFTSEQYDIKLVKHKWNSIL